mmetsp:Transcript_4667/g.9865  ORF Transcript_4667/g.9865 Transcript_4667/m.9865 type:complete len:205 (-) Transcript_4667:1850-2464(-)
MRSASSSLRPTAEGSRVRERDRAAERDLDRSRLSFLDWVLETAPASSSSSISASSSPAALRPERSGEPSPSPSPSILRARDRSLLRPLSSLARALPLSSILSVSTPYRSIRFLISVASNAASSCLSLALPRMVRGMVGLFWDRWVLRFLRMVSFLSRISVMRHSSVSERSLSSSSSIAAAPFSSKSCASSRSKASNFASMSGSM